MSTAHKLTKLTYNDHFYKKLHRSIVLQFPRLQRYPQMKSLAQAAVEVILRAVGKDSLKLKGVLIGAGTPRAGAWNASNTTHRLLANADHNTFLLGTAVERNL
jgi:hypothetical protein